MSPFSDESCWPGRRKPLNTLTDPVARGCHAEDAFHVEVPDAPGFGFSTPVTEPGWDTARVAHAYDTLMRRLGYERYGVHGSDHGAMVAREPGILNPEGFLGLHVLQLFSLPSGVAGFADDLQTIKVFAERDNSNIVH